MGFEYQGPSSRPDQQQYQNLAPQKGAGNATESTSSSNVHSSIQDDSITNNDATQPRLAVYPALTEKIVYQEPDYREHTSARFSSPAPRPVSPYSYPRQPSPYQVPYPAYPGYPAYGGGSVGYPPPAAHNGQPYPVYAAYPAYPGYYGYQPYTYPWQPPKPKRDTYLFVISIVSFVGAILAVLGGLVSLLFLLLFSVAPTTSAVSQDQLFGANVLFVALTLIGLVGGGFSLYHSIRSLFLKKPSADFKLPWFWTFLGLYLGVIVIAIILHINNQSVTNVPLTVTLIGLSGLLPALTILALAVRRLHYPAESPWPTTWRRFTLALVSGGTSAILFAMIGELVLQIVVTIGLNVSGFDLNTLNQSLPTDPAKLLLLFILVSVIAPVVEETVKPLAVIALIGRVRSASEAFVLGLACGIGFDLIETSGYIGQGYKDWLTVAIERSSAGLLHGFGAAMVSLGWYLLTHKNSANNRILLGLGCGVYAALQHALWNGSFLLALLPAPLGPYLGNGAVNVPLGSLSFSFDAMVLVYIVETALMLTFFFFVTGKLRGKKQRPSRSVSQPDSSSPRPYQIPVAGRV
ncbi:MAG TPA: PrsW family glutamic-type intramembrane protease [Ktedonosporobacter sp.]|nr:PrsW family glutamic-type intramembrane protease [Ktedonosporobacter sp.]